MKRINFINHSIPREWVLHLFSWIFLFGFPGMLMHHGREGLAGTEWIRILGAPLTLCIVFYANYLVWIEKYWMTHKIKEFCTANIVTFLLAFIFSRFWFLAMDILFPLHTQRPPFEHTTMTEVFFYFREFINYCYATALAGSLRMSQQWHKAELGRQEAELKRTEAELQNLKNQINPHFLLNTLNNIYALIAFDQDKAQQAVQDLSKLLRHVLYENDQHYTSLNHEIEFLKNYISLMRIRLSDQVEVKLDINIPKENNLKIAPLIFIWEKRDRFRKKRFFCAISGIIWPCACVKGRILARTFPLRPASAAFCRTRGTMTERPWKRPGQRPGCIRKCPAALPLWEPGRIFGFTRQWGTTRPAFTRRRAGKKRR